MLNYYFASANSGQGFINYFPKVFSDLDYYYILKGGPGTGKSSLMKAIAQKADSYGMNIDCYLCSSDPESLDGVIIKELSVGIIDGTAPHECDPVYPGVKSEIINLGSFWDKSKLKENLTLIKELSDKKSKEFEYSYRYLATALKTSRTKDKLTQRSANISKIEAFGDRVTKKLVTSKGDEILRLTDANTVKGQKKLDTFEDEAKIIYYIDDRYGISDLIFKSIKNRLKDREFFISHSALDPQSINMIYIPASKTLFSKNEDKGKRINTKRFINTDIYSELKPDINKCKVITEKLMSMAFKHLANAGKYHFELEKIYIAAMDFKQKEAEQQRLIKEIFS